MNLITEPVRLVSRLRALVAAIIAILTAFDIWAPTADQLAAIAALWVPLELLLGEFVRSKVTPAEPAP